MCVNLNLKSEIKNDVWNPFILDIFNIFHHLMIFCVFMRGVEGRADGEKEENVRVEENKVG
jgi:hypothetical protein